jgi:hypothetical protein
MGSQLAEAALHVRIAIACPDAMIDGVLALPSRREEGTHQRVGATARGHGSALAPPWPAANPLPGS